MVANRLEVMSSAHILECWPGLVGSLDPEIGQYGPGYPPCSLHLVFLWQIVKNESHVVTISGS
jgi:hypothetical protein